VKRVYLDTSVFFRIFFDEPRKEEIDRIVLLAKDRKIQIVISEWVVNEAVAAVQKKVSKEKIDQTEAHNILVAIAEFLEENYKSQIIISYKISEDVILTSRAVIQNLNLHASDALHVHIAISSDCKYFITADRGLGVQLRALGSVLIPVDIEIQSDLTQFFSDVDIE